MGLSQTREYASVRVSARELNWNSSSGNKWYDVVSGDTCASVTAAFSITLAQFLSWNPAVSSDCSQNFWIGDSYCVGVSASTSKPASTTSRLSTSSSRTSAAGSTTTGKPTTAKETAPDKPTLSGIPCQCNLYYDVIAGDSCSVVESKFGISHAQFLAWNPSVSEDCTTNFLLSGFSYCVGAGTGSCSSSIPASTSRRLSATGTYSIITGELSASQGPIPTATGWPPTPTQSGIAADCKCLSSISSSPSSRASPRDRLLSRRAGLTG